MAFNDNGYFLLKERKVFFLIEIGKLLKKTREDTGISLEEAGNDLEIKPVILDNIESGNIGSFKDIYFGKNQSLAGSTIICNRALVITNPALKNQPLLYPLSSGKNILPQN